ncbi:hypothetical protein STRCI_000646 [Streptomyces cinnabarinus]|uniref:Uncharacterized protein n=1 Tax=Streptomyces cinnabarinus TaxID=67287 RepID=A0ABY7K713_9ACTN|nr:hypothetical protein [Streptomyces cinnabarinus]WAZ19585.1 hypothetical protein STRCI_000646 [Streptomyces cinnabarinus]
MSERLEFSAASPVSVSLSLGDPADVSKLVKVIRGTLAEVADSVALSVRGSKSVVVGLLSDLEDNTVAVSARISLRADRPVKE